jgi:hypothetical protein
MASQVIAEKRRCEPGAPDVSYSPTLVKSNGQVHQRWNCFRSVPNGSHPLCIQPDEYDCNPMV